MEIIGFDMGFKSKTFQALDLCTVELTQGDIYDTTTIYSIFLKGTSQQLDL